MNIGEAEITPIVAIGQPLVVDTELAQHGGLQIVHLADVLSPAPSRPGVVCISERWETQEALNSHMKAPHMAEFQSKVAGFGVTGMSVTSYEAASETKLI